PQEVQFDVGVTSPEVGPFLPRLLHAILAEDALAGLEQRDDRSAGKGLRHTNQRDGLGITPALARGAADSASRLAPAVDDVHQRWVKAARHPRQAESL